MINSVLTKVFGTKHDREIKKLHPIVDQINAMEPEIKKLSDEQLAGRTVYFREKLAQGQTLDDILVEVFACVRESAWRNLGMRHYDVQMIGGIVLHQGRIAEMKTGEGKTLVATSPVYLNALTGKGVHVVTVNDYLARRDAEWMAPVYESLGMTVGVVQSNMPEADRKAAYNSDITFATNNELGFDLLRDNMKFSLDNMVQRGHHFAIIDEVDSILVDEARTPLIISGPSEESVDKYYNINRIIPKFERGEEHETEEGVKYTTGDFLVDEKAGTVTLTEDGVARAEKLLNLTNLYDIQNMEFVHGINQGLRAHHLYKRDVDYLVKDNQVVIVDEFTGRMMPGRRWSDGLHQAVEAKEGVKIEKENQTLATITFQNYFRMYEKLAGMTGTAETEEAEFAEIYKLEVSVIPTNRPLARLDHPDLIFRSEREKWDAVVEEIKEAHAKGQPVLVGTISIESSETLSASLKRAGVRHVVLNAKYHGREASIVAQAGRKGAVTIATNMAGRGTDIVLGGNPEGLARSDADPEKDPEAYEEALARYQEQCKKEREEVLAAGGLYILGTERHESRRIDNQLRGRSGRQGDHGASRFFLSLEDDLMRIFGTDKVKGFITRNMEEGEVIEHKFVSKAIERAQSQVEGRNFEVRKHLLKYDDVMNKQREAIYQLRSDMLDGSNSREYLMGISKEILQESIDTHCSVELDPRDWDVSELATDVRTFFDIDIYQHDVKLDELGIEEMKDAIWRLAEEKYSVKEARHSEEIMRSLEKTIMLQSLDGSWKDHLLALDHLKEGIHLRAHGQRDPLNEYKKESFELFGHLRNRVEDQIVRDLFRVEPMSQEEMEERRRRMIEEMRRRFQFSAPSKSAAPAKPKPNQRDAAKVGRNDPCPCGSGKKYKKCHGRTGAGAPA